MAKPRVLSSRPTPRQTALARSDWRPSTGGAMSERSVSMRTKVARESRREKGGGQRRTRSSRQRSCSQNHCSGCSRTQPSTTAVIFAVAAADVDQPLGVARHLDRRRQFQMQPSVGQADRPRAVHRTVELAGELRRQRIGRRRPAEERHAQAAAPAAGRPACRGARRAPWRRRSRRRRRGCWG